MIFGPVCTSFERVLHSAIWPATNSQLVSSAGRPVRSCMHCLACVCYSQSSLTSRSSGSAQPFTLPDVLKLHKLSTGICNLCPCLAHDLGCCISLAVKGSRDYASLKLVLSSLQHGTEHTTSSQRHPTFSPEASHSPAASSLQQSWLLLRAAAGPAASWGHNFNHQPTSRLASSKSRSE